MAINYLGHFMLTHLLLPQLQAGAEILGEKSRVINVASNVHEVGIINYNDFHCQKYYRASMAYANSKLAQIMFTYQLEKLFREEGWKIQTYAPHPGVCDTDIFQRSLVNHIPGWKRFLFKVQNLFIDFENSYFDPCYFYFYRRWRKPLAQSFLLPLNVNLKAKVEFISPIA
jgi:NAD(P)-dependent dehydrogenase (short-subunit alcohol dehydrogenase family)